MLKPKMNVRASLWSLILVATVLGHVSQAADPPAKSPLSTPAVNVPKYVEQLSKLSDEEVQSAADTLVKDLLGEFRLGSAVAQSRNRRDSYQRYRKTLEADLKQCDVDYQTLTQWLHTQKKLLEQQAGSNPAAIEQARSRFESLVERQSESALAIESRRESLERQLQEMDGRIERELRLEATTLDDMNTVRPPAIQPRRVPLPEDSANTFATSPSDRKLPLAKEISNRSAKPGETKSSETKPTDPKLAGANRRLMESIKKQENVK